MAKPVPERPDAEAYPLYWPESWRKTPSGRRRRARYQVGFSRARDELVRSLELMGARYTVLSTNVELRRDGLPYANRPQPDDVGVAVYWWDKHTQQPMCVACDQWDRVKDNVRAIGLAIEGMRAIHRSGASQILERAYQGFKALPSGIVTPAPIDWRRVLGLKDLEVGVHMVESAYRELAKRWHPDAPSGSHELMTKLNQARDAALAEVG